MFSPDDQPTQNIVDYAAELRQKGLSEQDIRDKVAARGVPWYLAKAIANEVYSSQTSADTQDVQPPEQYAADLKKDGLSEWDIQDKLVAKGLSRERAREIVTSLNNKAELQTTKNYTYDIWTGCVGMIILGGFSIFVIGFALTSTSNVVDNDGFTYGAGIALLGFFAACWRFFKGLYKYTEARK